MSGSDDDRSVRLSGRRNVDVDGSENFLSRQAW